jgi:hypothetical protein
VPTSDTDVAQLAGLLRHESLICTSCAATKLAVPLERLLDAAVQLNKTVAVHQEIGACPICGRNQWVMSLEERVDDGA